MYESDKNKYQDIINRIINANSGKDLKTLLDEVYSFEWRDKPRQTFLLGLLQGAMFQYNKDVAVEELENLLYNL